MPLPASITKTRPFAQLEIAELDLAVDVRSELAFEVGIERQVEAVGHAPRLDPSRGPAQR
jgi:hypothetical protein